MSSELKVPADPLLHKRSTEAARETHDETDEPKDIDANGITWRFECVSARRVQMLSIRDPHKFLSDLSKKRGGHVAGIGLEVLVAFDKECSDRRGEYTRLKTNFQGKRGCARYRPF
jgi:hypothetical protein